MAVKIDRNVEVAERVDAIEEHYYSKKSWRGADVLWLIKMVKKLKPYVTGKELMELREEVAALRLHLQAAEMELKKRG